MSMLCLKLLLVRMVERVAPVVYFRAERLARGDQAFSVAALRIGCLPR